VKFPVAGQGGIETTSPKLSRFGAIALTAKMRRLRRVRIACMASPSSGFIEFNRLCRGFFDAAKEAGHEGTDCFLS